MWAANCSVWRDCVVSCGNLIQSGLTVIVEQVPVIVEHRIVGGIGKSIAL